MDCVGLNAARIQNIFVPCVEEKLAHSKYIIELNALKQTLLDAGDKEGANNLDAVCYELGILAGLRFQLEKLGNAVLIIDDRSQDSHSEGVGAIAHAVRLMDRQHAELESLRIENLELRSCDER